MVKEMKRERLRNEGCQFSSEVIPGFRYSSETGKLPVSKTQVRQNSTKEEVANRMGKTCRLQDPASVPVCGKGNG
ncbi:predicted protein [Pyrenophora tritici-repentis Pt-1C-BFP]|uniref:Uncharacterized protein n=1 Tax=Pyrenophora tritici-repentis (strain Pt-1C-BFP) TaxID=426418 RepID=B2VYE4_PYRTR|nr:uncharacterized protein PTRG_02434 [Pyrenophora tritici-repentis Pt-1C-BFP]EDU44957.1 predicted protein [Pyrenophora tritici-repentis Pt-1C-BFP]